MRKMLPLTLLVLLAGAELAGAGTRKVLSHPPLRTPPEAPKRTLAAGPAYYVDAQRGDDRAEGSKSAPWKTIAHAVTKLTAGDTLYLRGGVHYENVRISLVGRKDAPITISSFPGEQAIIDGGLREFFDRPADCWQPVKDSEGEYRSTRAYPNLRHVLGAFGDSMIGLIAYYHARDLRADGEFFELDEATKDWKSLYCGPGIWYDPATGHVHARLRHTTVPGFDNYKGETDPRKLPLVIAPFRAVPLRVDGGRHIRFQDLTIRGSGYDAVVLDQCSDIDLDNVTIWAGTYGLRATGVHRLRVHRCGLYGSIPPWLSRAESGLQSYPGRPQRDIARLNTHALLVAEAGREFSVYAFPFNDDWDIGHSEFTEGSDGVYLGGINMKFHDNLLDNMQDDGIYLSPMYDRYPRLTGKAAVHIYRNRLSRALTMLAFGGPEPVTHDTIYFYRNIVELCAPVQYARPTSKAPGAVKPYVGKVMGDHGSPPWPSMFTYHNTIISRDSSRGAEFLTTHGSTPERPRRVFNNIFVHGKGLTTFTLPDAPALHSDGNLYWQPGLDAKIAADFFTKYRASPAFRASTKAYAPGFDAGSKIADPAFAKMSLEDASANDYRLQPGSPAIDAGVSLPAEWPDPLRSVDKGRPDVGALPAGAEMLRVGRMSAP